MSAAKRNAQESNRELDESEGHFTPSKKRTRFFRTKGFLRIFDGFFLQTKGFLLKAYEIFLE